MRPCSRRSWQPGKHDLEDLLRKTNLAHPVKNRNGPTKQNSSKKCDIDDGPEESEIHHSRE